MELLIVQVVSETSAQTVLTDGADIALIQEKGKEGSISNLICRNDQILTSIEKKVAGSKKWWGEKEHPTFCVVGNAQQVIADLGVFYKVNFQPLP